MEGSRKQGVHLEEKETLKEDSSLQLTFSRERVWGIHFFGGKGGPGEVSLSR